MPNKMIYSNSIDDIEKNIGSSFIDRDGMAKQLKRAWNSDETIAKEKYLNTYRKIFRSVLEVWSDKEFSIALSTRSDKMPDLKKCLLKTDEYLKLCAMALIPELREKEDILSFMTFGVIEEEKLKEEFIAVRKKYFDIKESDNIMKKRKQDAYDKYKKEWEKSTTHKITAHVRDADALKLMEEEEKIDYALALEAYLNDSSVKRPLDLQEKDLIKDALIDWKKEVGCPENLSFTNFVTDRYFEYAAKLNDEKWVDDEIKEAINQYNLSQNPIKQDINRYKEVENIAGDTMEMVGEFFMQEELAYDIKEAPDMKERIYLEEKATEFNQKYSLHVNKDKLRSSIEQVTALMIKAREEKERYLSDDNVVVIENGVEKCYTVKEYFNEKIEKAKKEYADKIEKIEKEREKAEQDYNKLSNSLADKNGDVGQEQIEKLQAENEKIYKDKKAEIDKRFAEAKKELEKTTSAVKGGIVIEKNGKEEKQYKSSQYYETHETQKEQYAYGEYQRMFSRVYKDACKNLKEQNYSQGKETDFSKVAWDVDRLFKSAMYISNIYENEKNKELVQKCSFGGFSAEQLASFVTKFDGDLWASDQSSEKVWAKQVSNAKNILSQWAKEEKENPKIKISEKIATTLNDKCKKFAKGDITPKEMLDYTIAATSHLQNTYPSGNKKFFNIRQYNREKKALNECRKALGLTEMSSLRVAMNKEYAKISERMSKEEVFRSMGVRMNCLALFKEEKRALETEHQIVKDRVVAEKIEKLEQLKEKGKEPIAISELDEKNVILNQKPRVEPISVKQEQKDLKVQR